MTTPRTICLITPGHVASTPRLVKSADALAEAGYRVRVVAGAPYPPADRLDAEILSMCNWEYIPVNSRRGAAVLTRKIIRRIARKLAVRRGLDSTVVAARAHLSEATNLAKAASRFHADLYIGHCIAGLYAASSAAFSNKTTYGFDIEDYHDAETQEAMDDPAERRARYVLQSNLLPGCASLTCAAPLIGDKYREKYNVSATTVLNVFPLSQAPEAQVHLPIPTPDRPATFYWFSQTIGPGRGLEGVIAAIGLMRTPVELHLRGFVSSDYAGHLQSLADRAGFARAIKFLLPGSPNEMARLASTADLGLSLEQSQPLNHDICLPNKNFVYLLGGIPQLMSTTSAQRALAAEFGDAAILCDLTRANETAARLDMFFSDPGPVRASRDAAWDLAHRRFCWDVEKEIVLESVKIALSHSI